MEFSEVFCRRPLLTENAVLELNKITGTSRVFERMEFLHLFEFFLSGIKLVVIQDKPAVSLVASFISESVIPQVIEDDALYCGVPLFCFGVVEG